MPWITTTGALRPDQADQTGFQCRCGPCRFRYRAADQLFRGGGAQPDRAGHPARDQDCRQENRSRADFLLTQPIYSTRRSFSFCPCTRKLRAQNYPSRSWRHPAAGILPPRPLFCSRKCRASTSRPKFTPACSKPAIRAPGKASPPGDRTDRPIKIHRSGRLSDAGFRALRLRRRDHRNRAEIIRQGGMFPKSP